MGDSLEMLSSQTEKKKNRKLRNMQGSLRKLEKKRKDKKFRHNNELNDTFEKNSHSSLAALVKEEKGGEEKEVEKPVKKKYRKLLDKCRDLQTLKDRTQDILGTIRRETVEQEQGCYMSDYPSKSEFGLFMSNLEEELDVEPGPTL